MENQTQTESTPASDASADADVAYLEALIAEERKRQPASTVPEVKSIGNVLAKTLASIDAQRPMPDESERLRREVSQQRQREWDCFIAQAGERYRKCSLENYKLEAGGKFASQQQAAFDAVKEFASEIALRLTAGQGLVLFGPVGTGKDHLAIAVCREAVKAGMQVRFLNGLGWYGELRDLIDKDADEASMLRDLCRPQVLVISDPLPPKTAKDDGILTAYQAAWLYRVADRRNAMGRITIVTLNVKDDAEADNRMGTATWDRLCHGSWKIRCAWPTYRKPERVVN
jgi:DNA replication protein DnaC